MIKFISFLGRLSFLLLIPLVSVVHYELNTYRPGVRRLYTELDSFFTFKPIFSIPYLYWFIFVYIILVYFAVKNPLAYYKLLASIVFGMLICETIFYFFPTTVPRPNITKDGFLFMLVRFIYSMDNPYNCFPSIHVLNASLVTMFFCKYGKGKMLKLLSIISCILICLSTLYVKQHYLLDIVSAASISFLLYFVLESKLMVRYSLGNKLPFTD